jgi:hypothetical protein
VILAVGLGLVAAAAFVAVTSRRRPVSVGAVPSAPAALAPASPTERPVSTGQQTSEGLEPQFLEIPALALRAPVQAVYVDPAGALGVPSDPRVVGWWAAGPQPGAATGTAVIDGHVDTAAQGPGALFRTSSLRPGDEVLVRGQTRVLRFRVTALREYSKTLLPAAEVFSRTTAGRLVIVTCGGPFDKRAGHYRDNVVVYAVPEDRS